MKDLLVNTALLFCILFVTGCTTITRGNKDTLVIETDPPGADIEISNGLRGKTPASFKMSRKEEVVVKITKEGYEPVEVNVSSQMVSAGGIGMAGNVLIGGLIGMGIDAATGATNDLKPNPIEVTLEKIGGGSDNTKDSEPDGKTRKVQVSTGTAFSIGGGYFVTAAHVIEGNDHYHLIDEGNELPLRLVSLDAANDIAVIKADTEILGLPIRSGRVQLGEEIFTIGFPNPDIQGEEPKFTNGTISSNSGPENDPRLFQVSCEIQPGNSGGPLCDINGNVIGIVVSKLSDLYALKNTGAMAQNVNYAIKIRYLMPILQDFEIEYEVPSESTANTLEVIKNTTPQVFQITARQILEGSSQRVVN